MKKLLELSFRRPDVIANLSPTQRGMQCEETDDWCIMQKGQRRFFIRGLIPLPLIGEDDTYSVGAWAEVSEEHMLRIAELGIDPEQSTEKPLTGTLANSIPGHEGSLGMAIRVQLTGPRTRPYLLVDAETGGELYRRQQRGISREDAMEYLRGIPGLQVCERCHG